MDKRKEIKIMLLKLMTIAILTFTIVGSPLIATIHFFQAGNNFLAVPVLVSSGATVFIVVRFMIIISDAMEIIKMQNESTDTLIDLVNKLRGAGE